MTNPDTLARRQRTGKIVGFVAAAVAVLILVAYSLWGVRIEGAPGAMREHEPKSTPSATPTPSSTPEPCSETWAMESLPVLDTGRLVEDVPEILNASSDEDAAHAATVVLDRYKGDPDYLIAVIKVNLHEDVDSATLFDAEGCATHEAKQYVVRVAYELGRARIIVNDAPTTATNTGVNEAGTVVSAEAPGIGGNRKAIKIVLADGTTYWIMGRCGNFAIPGPPPLPPGRTDQCVWNPELPPNSPDCVPPPTPVCEWNPQLPPDSPECLEAKRIAEAPQNQDNLPEQQMPNQLPARQDHFQPVAPADPPATVPAAPAAPAPSPAPVPDGNGGTIPAPAPEPTPVIIPPVEAPSGPPPSTCVPAPGESTC